MPTSYYAWLSTFFSYFLLSYRVPCVSLQPLFGSFVFFQALSRLTITSFTLFNHYAHLGTGHVPLHVHAYKPRAHTRYVQRTVIMLVNAPPPDRFFKLDYSVTKKVTIPNDTFSDSPRRDLSNAALFGAEFFLLWRYRASKVGPGGGRLLPLVRYIDPRDSHDACIMCTYVRTWNMTFLLRPLTLARHSIRYIASSTIRYISGISNIAISVHHVYIPGRINFLLRCYC